MIFVVRSRDESAEMILCLVISWNSLSNPLPITIMSTSPFLTLPSSSFSSHTATAFRPCFANSCTTIAETDMARPKMMIRGSSGIVVGDCDGGVVEYNSLIVGENTPPVDNLDFLEKCTPT
uniref:Uncharacterized protein n=1 Tax=Percolomonas cosmopolitus TaxID=63605 RepID=A0A7S1KNU6_9EUKA